MQTSGPVSLLRSQETRSFIGSGVSLGVVPASPTFHNGGTRAPSVKVTYSKPHSWRVGTPGPGPAVLSPPARNALSLQPRDLTLTFEMPCIDFNLSDHSRMRQSENGPLTPGREDSALLVTLEFGRKARWPWQNQPETTGAGDRLASAEVGYFLP